MRKNKTSLQKERVRPMKKRIHRKKRRQQVEKVEKRRLIIFLTIILLLFSVVSLKLCHIMLFEQKKYQKNLKELTYTKVEGPSSPRGRIYDRNGVVIVDNKAIKTIYYKKDKKTTTKEEIELAYLVSPHLNLDASKLEERNKREFYLVKYQEKVKKLITKKEWEKYHARELSNKEIEELELKRIPTEELNAMTEEDNKAAYLYFLMNKGYTYDEKVIRTNDVTEEEYAYIAENNQSLGGFNVKLDWERVYPYGDTFRTFLGNVSSSASGLPLEEKDYYLSLGYSLNDRVGISYLEKQYEEYLHGSKDIYQVVNRHELKLLKEGKRGNDIVLTIDIKLQQEVERILAEQIISAKSEANTNYYDHSFVVLQEPTTGEILAMAGKQAVNMNGGYEIRDYSPALLTSPMTPGSVVKGASMLVGYNENAVKMGEYMLDECVKIAGVKEKCSSQTLGRIDDITALAKSSNVYQFKIAMRIAGREYQRGMRLPFNQEAFDKYRAMYHSFGLGVKTEIDLPIESLGYTSKDTQAGNLLDFVMGQYETYTPIQLSQYITTIANGGSRLQPHLLKEVREATTDASVGKVIKKFETKVLNKINTKEEYLNRVKEGFHAVVMRGDGYGRGYMEDAFDGAGKTGTSQSFIDTDGDDIIDTETISTAFIGYAPSVNPKMTITVTSPNSSNPNTGNNHASFVTMRITKAVSSKFFEFYPL